MKLCSDRLIDTWFDNRDFELKLENYNSNNAVDFSSDRTH